MQFGEEASALFLKSNKFFFNGTKKSGLYQKKLILAFE